MRLTASLTGEELRLNDLRSYHILDTEEEKDFSDLVELVRQIYDCPVGAIAFVDEDRLWFKSLRGLTAPETQRQHSPCSTAIEGEGVFVVPDMSCDERFRQHPLLAGSPGLKFYAGAPIVSAKGYKLGTVCISDYKARRLTARQSIGLTAIANQITKLLELKERNRLAQEQASQHLRAEKEVTRSILKQQEKQRMNIGTELHENIAQGLAATKLYLQTMSASVEHPFLAMSVESVNEILQQVKDLTHTIVPTTLQNTGLKSLLEILANRYRNRHGYDVNFTYEGCENPGAEVTLSLYRMAEEAFENIHLHAAATEVRLDVKVNDGIEMTVVDNGIGVKEGDLQKGAGLGSIASLADYFGGTAVLTCADGKGCKLLVQLPSGRSGATGNVKKAA